MCGVRVGVSWRRPTTTTTTTTKRGEDLGPRCGWGLSRGPGRRRAGGGGAKMRAGTHGADTEVRRSAAPRLGTARKRPSPWPHVLNKKEGFWAHSRRTYLLGQTVGHDEVVRHTDAVGLHRVAVAVVEVAELILVKVPDLLLALGHRSRSARAATTNRKEEEGKEGGKRSETPNTLTL